MADVTAEWPGLVKEIHVSIGDAVDEEQELMLLESMKMLTPVLAPAAGTVAEIHVAVDAYVETGAKLLTIA
jgi:biotin carboxyl carrier protein